MELEFLATGFVQHKGMGEGEALKFDDIMLNKFRFQNLNVMYRCFHSSFARCLICAYGGMSFVESTQPP